MELRLTEDAKADIKFFVKSGQVNIVKKIQKILEAIEESPFTGIGKPELLKHGYSDKWSRRIDTWESCRL